MTQESVNEKRTSDVNYPEMEHKGLGLRNLSVDNIGCALGNQTQLSMMNPTSMSGDMNFRPSMMQGFGQGFMGSRVNYIPNYPQLHMPNYP
ncbi:hypothetical protein SESBI_21244 [Sesbania bispinosa]|nr:hypothetical protein SESBI_21244 [Sesbania bispinosa]